MRLELSRRAEADLADIRDYSAEQFGIDRAIAYVDGIEDAFRLILEYPKTGSLHPTLNPPVRSLACQRHRIFYA
ncbi:MAG: type II toxin-antitoxin system RelE/ParE family toxin, partial [Sphingomonas sp.]|nr:type II toxin-antitoxin system RelE/ParE family toxin [Sphingomonas sp.]